MSTETPKPKIVWQVHLYDLDGYSVKDVDLREWVELYEQDKDEALRELDPRDIVIVTGTAVPTVQHDGEPPKEPGTCQALDVFAEWDITSFEASEMIPLWERAQAVAAAMNAAGVP